MALYLVNPGVDLTLELFISPRIEEAVAIQFERIKDRKVREIFVRKLEKHLEGLLVECIDWDLKQPTEAQISYAVVIAKQLGISLPSEARKYRFHMAMFLEAHAQLARGAKDDVRRSPALDLSAGEGKRVDAEANAEKP